MNLINSFLPAIEHFSSFGYWFIFFIALLESLAFVGLIIPGAIIIIFMGFLSLQGFYDLGDLIWFTVIGAVIGDSISFMLGRRGRIFKKRRLFFKESYLAKGKRFFKSHGTKSVFLGRFIGSLRPIIPFVTGISKMEIGTFFFLDVLSVSLWAITYLLLGYLFGHAWNVFEIWSPRVGIFFLIISILVVTIYIFDRFVVTQGRQLLKLFKSILRSFKEALVINSDVRRIIKKHPKLFRFIKHRTNRQKFTGFRLTLLILSFFYVLTLFMGLIEDVLRSDMITQADIRIEKLLFIFRHPSLIQFFTWVTVLGKWQLILTGTILLSIFFWIQKEKYHLIALWITISGSALFVFIGKLIIHRPRPNTAYYIEYSFAFPSGHAALAMALYGFVAYYLLVHSRKWKWKINALFLNSLIIGAIGLSRLYLGAHFLSDVLAGYLLGFLWVLIGISVVGWLDQKHPIKLIKKKPKLSLSVGITGILLAQAVFLYGYASIYNPIINVHNIASEDSIVTSNVLGPFKKNKNPLSRYSESITGNIHEPLNFIIVAKNDDALINAFIKAGWYSTDMPTEKTLGKMVYAFFTKTGYPEAPMTPLFWNSEVNDLAFQKPTETNTINQRHHTRVWRSQIKTKDGKTVYVGMVNFDEGVKWLITHRIKPDIDTEANLLVSDLKKAGVTSAVEKKPFVDPVLSKNVFGDSFFTNGNINIIYLK